jgi:hypothetical protein
MDDGDRCGTTNLPGRQYFIPLPEPNEMLLTLGDVAGFDGFQAHLRPLPPGPTLHTKTTGRRFLQIDRRPDLAAKRFVIGHSSELGRLRRPTTGPAAAVGLSAHS